ncbi:ABC transporter ATP-binding protein [Candidatus Saccharibacteria bacterium]|nr:ABC transporter ATP-binding protein [Candidatus Saccharibacteria bacterium]MBI3337896.1 ABC transporter ATP-binding protein [Candidatus Saccharibacteria bacterium]
MSDDIAIKVSGVSKNFRLPHEKIGSIKNVFTGIFRLIRKNRSYETQHALKNVSFEVKKGEFFGIVGRNGSGKSTLLKMLAGIYQPTKGSIQVTGKLVPFIELGVGFSPELTGRENVYLNGALLGFSKKEIDDQYDDIVEFAELEKFMDQKLKNYSSGMQVRLAFSMAIRAKADILLIDEVLAVGDADFQRKCFNYFKKLKKDKKTVVFVSHDMNAIRQFCNKALLIDGGMIQSQGDTDQIAQAYTELFIGGDPGVATVAESQNRWGETPMTIQDIGVSVNNIEVSIKGNIISSLELTHPIFGFLIKNAEGLSVLGANSHMLKVKIPKISRESKYNFQVIFENILSDGQYTVDLALLKEDGNSVVDWWSDAISFSIKKDYISPYIVTPNIHLSIGIK